MSPGPNASALVVPLPAKTISWPMRSLVCDRVFATCVSWRERALVHAQQVDATGERVGAGLEDVGEQLAIGDRLERDLVGREGTVLDRRGEILDDRLEQAVGAEVAARDAAHDGEDRTVVGAALERVDDLLVGDLGALEVALHQLIGDLGDLVQQLLAILLGAGLLLGRDLDLGRVGATGALVAVGAHVDEVDHAAALLLGADRDLGRDDVRPERALELLQRPKEVGPLAVEHVDEQHPRDVMLGGDLPQPARADLDAHHGVDHEDRRLADAQRAERVGDEARLAGRVEQVDLAPGPLEGAERRRDRHLAGLLVGLGVGGGGPVDDIAQAGQHPGLKQQRLVQRGLAGSAMADEGHIANRFRAVRHAISPLLRGRST